MNEKTPYLLACMDRLAEIRAAYEELLLWAPRQRGYAEARGLFVERVADALNREMS